MTVTCTLGYPSPRGNSFTRSVLESIITGPCESVTLAIQLSCFIRRYRTFDGLCNNLCNVTRGSAQRPFSRLLPPAYQDGKHAPRSLGSNNQPLPNARNVSEIVFVSSRGNEDNATVNFTHLAMVWGQFLDHDITLTQLNKSVECGNNSLPCRGPEEGCIGIDILQGNELKDNQSAVCIPLRRSAIKNGEQASFYDKMLPRAWAKKSRVLDSEAFDMADPIAVRENVSHTNLLKWLSSSSARVVCTTRVPIRREFFPHSGRA